MKPLRAHDYPLFDQKPVFQPDVKALKRIGYGLLAGAVFCFVMVCALIALSPRPVTRSVSVCRCRGSCSRAMVVVESPGR